MNDNQEDIRSGFLWEIELVAPDGTVLEREVVKNLVPTEGLNHFASVLFKGGTPNATWYVGLFEGNYTPIAGATAATIAAASTETTAYDEATRVEWVEGTVASGALDNTASKAEFTFNANKTIYGGFLVSSSTKAGTTGVLASLVRFSSPKTPEAGAVLRVTAGLAFTSA